MKTLAIAPNLHLPADEAASQKYAFIGRSGSGKSYAAGKLVESLLDAQAQVVIVDPVGIWWGLRLAADGKGPGLDIPIFGGQHQDVPLEPTGGTLVADLIVDRGVSVVLDVSEFTAGEQRRFVADFATHLLQRKKQHRSPILIVWEESQEFVPQKVYTDAAKMVGAMERLIKIGRNFGIGTALISQRPQAVNKDVLNQTELLFVFQTTGPQERKAIEGWVVEHGLDLRAVVEQLPSLPRGDGYAWSPQWLQFFERIRVHPKRTFDASATPTLSGKGRKFVELGPIDLKQLRDAMAATIEKAKENDPKELRAQIAQLKKQLASQPAQVQEKVVTKEIEVPVIKDAQIERLAKQVARLEEIGTKALEEAAKVRDLIKPAAAPRPAPAQPMRPPAPRQVAPPPRREAAAPRPSEGGLGRAERAILTAIAQRHPRPCSKAQASLLSGYSIKSSSFANALSALRTSGFIEGFGDDMQITTNGLQTIGPFDAPPTGEELVAWWERKLGKAERALLRTLVDAYPNNLTKAEVSERSGYSITSSSFANALSTLRGLELIRGFEPLQASEILFGE